MSYMNTDAIGKDILGGVSSRNIGSRHRIDFNAGVLFRYSCCSLPILPSWQCALDSILKGTVTEDS